MNHREQESARIGLEALNASLVTLGLAPVGENPDVRMVEPAVGAIPNAVVDKAGVAPWRFVFGRDLDIWVGPYSGAAGARLVEETRGEVEDLITRVLRSDVTFRRGRRSVELRFRIPNEEPWLRLKVRGADPSSSLERSYEAYGR